jgi:hypothetical protein
MKEMSEDSNQSELNDRIETILLVHRRNRLEAETFVNCDKTDLPNRSLGPHKHRRQTCYVDQPQEGS